VSRVAIACQGGGSHTAFTAGALSRLLARSRGFDVVGLSGTSGGPSAPCWPGTAWWPSAGTRRARCSRSGAM
jgi:NTE family protein